MSPRSSRAKPISNQRKVAILLISLGNDLASKVIRNLHEDHIEQITIELSRLNTVTPEEREIVIQEMYQAIKAQEFTLEGGVAQARGLLEAAYGGLRADEMISRVVDTMQTVPFGYLQNADPMQVLSFIQDEHPQTIALVLAYMPVNAAAVVFTKFSPEQRTEVAARIASMGRTAPDVIKRVEAVLEKKMATVNSQDTTQAGGPKVLVNLLNRVDRSTERLIVDNLEDTAPDLAETIRGMMFVFEDVVILEDKAIQTMLKEVDVKELATALKGVNPNVQEKIFKNMSERAMAMLKEDMEFMGPVRMRVVEEAQQKIVAVIRGLEESGEIVISRQNEEDMLV